MPLRPRFPDVDIPRVDLWSFLFERAEPSDADKPLFVDATNSKRFWTFRTAKAATAAFGAALRSEWNWQHGDILGIFGLNDIDYPTVLLGGLWAGATVSPMSFTFTAKELAFQLQNSGAKAIVAHTERLEVVEEAARLAGLPSSKILLFGEEAKGNPKYKHYLQLRSSSPPKRQQIDPASDIALLVYSSGTTGLPKGVKLSHTNMVANVCQLVVTDLSPPSPGFDAKTLGFLPFAHIYAVTLLLLKPIFSETTIYVMPKFDLEQCLASIQNYKITQVPVAPPVALLFAKHPLIDQYNLSSLGGLLCAAAPLASQLIEDVYARLKLPIKQAYGLSETAPGITMQLWPDAFQYPGSVGPLLPNHTARLVSPSGEDVPPGQPGELWVKGPNIFLGYHNNDEATKNAFSEDGYFKTGDIVHLDTDGNLFVVDRMKELIKYSGYQVAPAELEAILLKNNKVSDVAVLGMYDDRIASEVPRAFIKASEGHEPTKTLGEEIAKWMDARVSYPKKLRGGVQFVDEVPKSPAGKILRRVLKDTYGTKITSTVASKL